MQLSFSTDEHPLMQPNVCALRRVDWRQSVATEVRRFKRRHFRERVLFDKLF
jgi:hypothetical protein